jgi:hypothetical protein
MEPPSASTVRQVTRVAGPQTRQSGHRVTDLAQIDPFVLLDRLGPTVLEPGKAGGELEQRLEGFDAITYVIRGEIEKEDEAGQQSVLRQGDVQWLTAGSGLVVSELPSRAMRELGGCLDVLHVHLALPRNLQGVPPRYQTFGRSRLPQVSGSGARITVIAGEALGVRGPVETNAQTTFQIWSLDAGAVLNVPLPTEQNAFVYVLAGTVGVGGAEQGPQQLGEGHLAALGPGDAVRIHGYVAPGQASLILLAGGAPIGGAR